MLSLPKHLMRPPGDRVAPDRERGRPARTRARPLHAMPAPLHVMLSLPKHLMRPPGDRVAPNWERVRPARTRARPPPCRARPLHVMPPPQCHAEPAEASHATGFRAGARVALQGGPDGAFLRTSTRTFQIAALRAIQPIDTGHSVVLLSATTYALTTDNLRHSNWQSEAFAW